MSKGKHSGSVRGIFGGARFKCAGKISKRTGRRLHNGCGRISIHEGDCPFCSGPVSPV